MIGDKKTKSFVIFASAKFTDVVKIVVKSNFRPPYMLYQHTSNQFYNTIEFSQLLNIVLRIQIRL